MLRRDHLILTLGRGPVFSDPCFQEYVKSVKRVPEADCVILSDDISDSDARRLNEAGVEVATCEPIKQLFRDRHMAYWNYLNEHGHKYRSILISDCRDVIFQRSPFAWINSWRERYLSIHGNKSFLDHFVILTAEGFRTSRSGFACVDHFEFQRDVHNDCAVDISDKWVVNGGVALGTWRALMNYHLLVWSMMVKSRGRCTDQAAINYLMAKLKDDETYSVSFPQYDWLCLTGEGVKEKVVEPKFDGDLKNPNGDSYCLIHQWDRLPDDLKNPLLAQNA
jgi:hypothetical protein